MTQRPNSVTQRPNSVTQRPNSVTQRPNSVKQRPNSTVCVTLVEGASVCSRLGGVHQRELHPLSAILSCSLAGLCDGQRLD